jgi:glycosyltransferase involved in cell wall biosynthesis
MYKPRTILAVDRPLWAFHNIAIRIAKSFSDDYWIKICEGSKLEQGDHCDILVCFWWNELATIIPKVEYRSLVLCVYDHTSWSLSQADRQVFQQCINHASVIAVANDKIAAEIASGAFELGTIPIITVEDGVDTGLFNPLPFPKRFTVGWAGNSAVGRGRIKGLGLIAEAANLAGVDLEVMDFCNCGGLPQWYMGSFYRNISCYVNASSSDGTPNPPLEAMASGRPVVTTPVGIMPQLVDHGSNGLLVNRTVNDLAEAIRRVKRLGADEMGEWGAAARAAAELHSWPRKLPKWRSVLRSAWPPKDRSKPLADRSKRKSRAKPRGLLVSDVAGWAFDINEKDMVDYCDRFDLDRYHLIDKRPPPDPRAYDFVFIPYHRWRLDHYWRGIPKLGSLRSQWFDPQKPRYVPEDDASFIRSTMGFHVVYEEAYRGLRGNFPQVVYLTNPVNLKRFPQQTKIDTVIAEWNGNASHGQEDASADVKGIHQIITPACNLTKTPLVIAEYANGRIAPDKMNAFYCRASVALCASKYEGASNSVMEAMACGLAVIATDVGNHREMMESQLAHYGATGIELVDRHPEAFACALRALTPKRVREMGEINSREIKARWSWDIWRDRYCDFFNMALQ